MSSHTLSFNRRSFNQWVYVVSTHIDFMPSVFHNYSYFIGEHGGFISLLLDLLTNSFSFSLAQAHARAQSVTVINNDDHIVGIDRCTRRCPNK